MRRTRWLLLAAILAIVFWVSAAYVRNKASFEANAPAAPASLDPRFDAQSQTWHVGKWDKATGLPVWKLRAKEAREVKNPPVTELEGVELELYNKAADEYHLVKSAKAQFDGNAKTLYSDGDVDIEMNIPVEGPRHGRMVKIHTSGVTFEEETGKARTDRRVAFQFDQGGGAGMGADYDPNTRELHMHAAVSLDWRGKTPESEPMHIEAGEAYYREKESKVILVPWSKMQRDTLTMEGGMTVVILEDSEVRQAVTIAGHGIRTDDDRKTEFGADRLDMHFQSGMKVDTISGNGNGRLVSNAETMRTTVTAPHLDLNFDTSGKDSVLAGALATGGGVAEAVPLPKPGAETKETKILRSETIHLMMKNAGRDIDKVETDGAGTLDFLPNGVGQAKRWMKGDKIWIAYGDENRIQSLRTINASTRTNKPADPGKPDPPPALTQSQELLATFDPKTSDLSHLEQNKDFKYEEGDRHGRANRAVLEQEKNLMTLDGAARIWDSTGSAAADKIVTNQKTGDFTADGHVASTHEPDESGSSSAMLSTDQILQARAEHMVSVDNNMTIHYIGNAVAWQGANRVEADRLDIDRDAGVMEAHGKVKCQFVDKDKKKDDGEGNDSEGAAKAPPPPPGPPVFTVVTAPDMVYTEDTRVVDYTGGVTMVRPDMTITSKTIRAFLKDADEDSSLDKAFADGTVKVVSTSQKLKRTRTGTSEHAEYYADDGKVVLIGGVPMLVDSVKGQTRAPKQLTWFSNDDRLIVDGAGAKNPVKSIIRKKPAK
jgi:lipopolysaccharide export system protein LptA